MVQRVRGVTRNISAHDAVSYAHMGAVTEDTTRRSTITRLILDLPSGLSVLPCGFKLTRRPSRVMMKLFRLRNRLLRRNHLWAGQTMSEVLRASELLRIRGR